MPARRTTSLALLLSLQGRGSALLAPSVPHARHGLQLPPRAGLHGALQQPAQPAISPIDVQIIQKQFARVRELPRVQSSFKQIEWASNPWSTLEVDDYVEPTFRRLFTHKTWERYTGGSSLSRLALLVKNWRFCAVLTRVWPIIAIISGWSFLVALLLPSVLLARLSVGLGTALQLQGTAIAFLLVFRTDNAYRRLEEARTCWARIVYLCREIVTKCAVSLEYAVVCDVARYLCAFSWALRDKLRTSKRRDDILELLLEPGECAWVSAQRSRPVALLGRIRQVLYREVEEAHLPSTQHYMIDGDVRELDEIVATCERLFSSPIPPNMARHGLRSLLLWFAVVPLFLAGTMPPLAVALVMATTTYIYVGIDELGVQVEQPFKILPLWQLCHLAQFNIEEALSSPELPLRVVRKRRTTAPEAERFDLDDDLAGVADEGEDPTAPSAE